MICKFCNNLDPRGHQQSVQMKEFRDRTELSLLGKFLDTVQGARDGCKFCTLLCEMAAHFISDLPDTMILSVLRIHLREGLAANVEVVGINPSQVPRNARVFAAFHFYNPSGMFYHLLVFHIICLFTA
jgi:hypothetical protein